MWIPTLPTPFEQMQKGMADRLNVQLIDTKGMSRTAARQEMAKVSAQCRQECQPALDAIKTLEVQQQMAREAAQNQQVRNAQGQFTNPAVNQFDQILQSSGLPGLDQILRGGAGGGGLGGGGIPGVGR